MIRKAAGIEFPGRDASTSALLAEVEMMEEPETGTRPLRVFTLAARGGGWELPALGVVTAPTAVLIRPDGYLAWVGDSTKPGLVDALTTWFGPPGAE